MLLSFLPRLAIGVALFVGSADAGFCSDRGRSGWFCAQETIGNAAFVVSKLCECRVEYSYGSGRRLAVLSAEEREQAFATDVVLPAEDANRVETSRAEHERTREMETQKLYDAVHM